MLLSQIEPEWGMLKRGSEFQGSRGLLNGHPQSAFIN
jgi:hypothetical protein